MGWRGRGWWGGAVGMMVLAGCATNPATGKSELMLVSEGQEIAMGQQGAKETLASMPLYPDSASQRLVRSIGMRMAAASERPQLPWNFYLLDDAAVNAFAYPGGQIFVTRGLMTYLNSEAELAGVIGHEVGHVTARHTARQMSNAQLAQVGLMAGALASRTVAGMVGGLSQGLQLLFLKFGRDDELQADELGFRYARRTDYDVREIPRTFVTLGRVSGAAGARLPEWQSTHPDPDRRAQRAAARADSVTVPGNAVANRDGYLQLLRGMVFGDDPRQGYFRANRFIHPNLGFELTFPAGWRTQNQPAAVIGVPESQNAVIQLALGGKEAPATLAQQFFAQQGVQVVTRPQATDINGLPASYGEFSASTEQGQLAGGVAYIRHGDLTYRIFGYAPAANWAQFRPIIREAARSFRPVTDRALLGVTPQTIELVKLPRDMSTDAFLQQYPSTASDETVLIVNGLDPDDRLRAGQLVKRIVGGVGR